MNTPSALLVVLLLQWTLLLALGWGVHGLCRHRHPRWRLILWRSILCFGFMLPLFSVLPLPRFSVPAPRLAAPSTRLTPAVPALGPVALAQDARIRTTASAPEKSASAAAAPVRPATIPATGKAVDLASISWPWVLAIVWFVGCGWELIRLLRLQLRLRQIVRDASVANAPVQSLAWQIQGDLKIRRLVRVRVSEAVSSPFLCGVRKPIILLSRRMAEELPPAELSALLSHEMAHEHRHDLAWCIAWRLMRAACWFHPLVWQIPEAHGLACEEEADRIAAQRVYEGDGYARLLARLALRVLRLPADESPLTLNATSHLARRLIRLGRERAAAWHPSHSLAGFAVAGALLVLTAGWQFAQAPAVEAPPVVATATVLVTVHDESGQPIEGATLTPTGLRAREERLRSTGYGWVPERHGALVKAVTDRAGQAQVTYPVAIVPAEKILTGEISFTVDHANFARAWSTGYPVDGTGKPVQLKRGIPLRIAGYFGAGRQRVAELSAHLLGDPLGVRPEDWQRDADGRLAWDRMTPGRHFLHLAGRLPSGEIVYSEGLAFFGEQRDAHDLSLELKPGVRVEGRLDANAPRPIKNGWAQLSVHDDEANTQQFPLRSIVPRAGNTGFWWSYRPIDADGRFVFESVPPGDLKVIAYGDGFISTNGPNEEQSMPPGIRPSPPRRATRGIPQSFAAVRPITTFEVATESTATLRIRAKTGDKPVAEAKIYLWPNVIQMPTGSRLFGGPYPSSEAPYRTLTPLPEPAYSVITDKDGVAVLSNVPAFTQSLGVQHAALEVALRESNRDPAVPARFRASPNRYVELTLSPGQTAEVEIALQPKGREFLGDSR